MISLVSFSSGRHFAFMTAAVVLGAALAQAGAEDLSNPTSAAAVSTESATYSSSNDFAIPELSSADPAASAASPAHGGGQYDNRGGGRSKRRWAFEAGGGFNA